MQHYRFSSGARDPNAQGIELGVGPAPRFGAPPHLKPPNFWSNLKDFIVQRSPRLPNGTGVDAFKVGGLVWAKRKGSRRAQIAAVALHAALVVLLFTPFLAREREPKEIVNVIYRVTPLYAPKLPPGKLQGGGSGGERNPLLASRGTLPKFSMIRLTPPLSAPPRDPKLAAEPTLLGPPELRIPISEEAKFGDPLAVFLSTSAGRGKGGGSGNGNDGGIGDGEGPGYGPGKGGGAGGDVYRAGSGGVGYPACLYCPAPEYSEDARKAKYQGSVLLQVLIDPDGRAADITVVMGPGLGLEEKAMEAVRKWRFRPALGPNSKPVATLTPIEIHFRLL